MEHRFLGRRVFVPFIKRCEVNGRELPLLQRMSFAFSKTPPLLLATDRKPELCQTDSTLNQIALEFRSLPHESFVLVLTTESHDALDPRAVVPGPVKQHNFAARGQMLDIPLKIPLPNLCFCRLFQGDNPGTARIEVLHEPFDCAPFAGCIPAFKQNDNSISGFSDPLLQLE